LEGIESLSVHEKFAEAQPSYLLYDPGDGHFNADGTRDIAEMIYQRLMA